MHKVWVCLLTFFLILFFKTNSVVYAATPTSIPTAAATQEVNVPVDSRPDMQTVEGFNKNLQEARNENVWPGERQMLWSIPSLANVMLCQLAGHPCGALNVAEQQQYFSRSVLGQTGTAMAYLYSQPPASTGQYLADLFKHTGLVPQTYAQGVTYSRLLPILPIWKTFRNISYILLTLVMLLIGVMIMFRQKINANAVASIENTIPNVVVTLILITFSYPIASLILDMMYVAIAAGIGLIGSAVGDQNVQKAIQDFTTGGFGTLFSKTLSPAAQSTAGTYGWEGAAGLGAIGGSFLIPLAAGNPLTVWPFLIIAALLGIGGAATGGSDIITGLLGGILSPILLLFIVLILFIAFFRILFMLIFAYVNIIVYIVFSPFLLLPTAISGGKAFESWWKNLAANASVFVSTAIILYFAWALNYLTATSIKSFWTPPFISNVPGMSQMAMAIISVGIALQVPQLVLKVKEMFKVKPALQMSPAAVVSGGTNILKGAWTGAAGIANFGRFKEGVKDLPDTLKKPLGGLLKVVGIDIEK